MINFINDQDLSKLRKSDYLVFFLNFCDAMFRSLSWRKFKQPKLLSLYF